MALRYIRRLTALVVPAVLLLANGATAGAALEVAPFGRVVANGAGVGIPVAVTCDAAGEGAIQSLFVQLRQAVGDAIASGIGFAEDFVCDGTPQPTTVPVFADPGSRPFTAGEAAVQVSLAVCSSTPEPGPVPLPGEAAPAQTVPPGPGPAPAPEPSPPPGPGPAPEPVPPPEPSPAPPPGGGSPCQLATASVVIFLHPADMHHQTPPVP
jgi:hypothetical protein